MNVKKDVYSLIISPLTDWRYEKREGHIPLHWAESWVNVIPSVKGDTGGLKL